VADAFGKNATEPATWAGPGYYAHRDGYNVLYGDWSAHWRGDPLQKFIWRWSAVTPYSIYGGDTNVVDDGEYGPTIASTYLPQVLGANASSGNGTVIQWHMLDLANGIDNLSNP
jgi:hypothetical protein